MRPKQWEPTGASHHSDRGSQYTSEQFQRLMADNGIVCSMSRSGNGDGKLLLVAQDRTNGTKAVPNPR
jgi:transposase InsO family protein